jgi:integrase
MDHVWSAHVRQWAKEQRVAGKAPSTIALWRRYLLSLSRAYPASEDDRPGGPWDVTRGEIIDWLDEHCWSPSTRRSARTAVRVFYGWAEDQEIIPVSPAAKLPKIKCQRTLPRPAPDDVIAEAIHRSSLRVCMMVMLAALCGLRRKEVAIAHTRDLVGQHLRVAGKGGKAREVPVPRALAAWIRAMPEGFLFPGNYGGHLSPPYVGKLMSRALPGRWTAHTLRHAAATAWADAGLDLHELATLLGHSSTSVTEIYTLVRPKRLIDGVEHAAQRLTRGTPPSGTPAA